ncbi:hypothetical protein HYU11_04650 [Candidatus Woesearchaeota archaeon]|nr:hypothetical protein [Candidatus Woesearchaeota archaeon]
MVKQLIEQFLKKEGQNKENKQQQVPDELPPLSEETISHKKTEAAPQAVPNELPSLSTQPEPVKSDEKKEIPLEFPTKQAPEPVEQQSMSFPQQKDEDVPSFFYDLMQIIKTPGSIDKVLSQDLLTRMKENWDSREKNREQGNSGVETEFSKRINELKYLEKKWSSQKIILEEEEKILKEREKDLAAKIVEFKKFLQRAKLYKHVPESNYLVLENCMVIKNLKDLSNALRVIDEKTLRKHLAGNEVISWVSQIDPKLASKLKTLKNKKDFVSAIHQYEKRLEGS